MAGIDLKEDLARAYAQAAQAEANMREAVAALETIRERLSGRSSYHEVFDALDEQIGQADLAQLVPALRGLRAAYSRSVVEMESERLKGEFSRDPHAGWREWLNTYARLFRETQWSADLGHDLAEQALVHSASTEWPVERVKRNAWLVWRERWPEAYDWFIFLAAQDIAAEYRARMLTIAAAIQLYHFSQPTRAEKLLEQAQTLAPGEHLVTRGWADLSVQRKRFDQAKALYQQIVDRRPRLADGYLGLADCADQEGDAVAAEAFYQQAVQFAPGMTSSHRALMKWYGKRLDEREALIMPIFRRLNALSDDEPGDCVALGVLYKVAEKYDRAREWLSRAIEQQPDNGLAEVWLGNVDCDEAAADPKVAAGRLASAEAHFRRDLDICPEALDGNWGISGVYMQRQEWETAKAWCDRSFHFHREWESLILARRAVICIELKDWTAAEQDLRRSLELEPENGTVLDIFSDLVDKIAPSDPKHAERLLGDWRQYKGASVEHLYQNRLANWRYAAGDYAGAEEHYHRAVTANPKSAVLHSNHARAAERLRTQFGRRDWLAVAIEELTHAIRLDPREPEYRARLSRLIAERDFIDSYGEPALELLPVVTPVHVDVPDDLLPAILDGNRRDLSKAALDRIDAWRRDFRARFGVPLPGIRFRLLEDTKGGGTFRILVMERTPYWGKADGASVLDAILQLLETVCAAHMTELLGHQETANLLRELDHAPASEIVETPAALTGFVSVLRRLLAHQVGIADLSPLVQQYLERYRAGVAPSMIADELSGRLQVKAR